MNKLRFQLIKYLVVLTLLPWWFATCSAPAPEGEETIATVGDRCITADHLRRSFQLEPKWGTGLTQKQAYANQLNFLIDQKLFALAALEDDLHEKDLLAGYLNFIEDKELIKALYQAEIATQVVISDAEYQRAYIRSKKRVKFNYIYTETFERAQHYFSQMKSVAFDSIRLLQPTFDRKGTTRMMSFGDLAPEIETFIFDMRPAEVAAPIEILNGYMVIQLVDGVVDKFLSEMDLAQQKSRLKKIIFERKAGPLANRYVKKLMLEKNLTLNPEAFFALSKLFSQLAETASPEPALVPVNLTDSELRAVDQNAQSLRESILASYEGGQLTVGEFLDKLQNMPAGLRPRVKMDRQVKDAIGVMVRNQFLAAEARQAGLHELPGVRNEVRIQQDQALAEYYLILEQKRKQIGDREIAAFKQSAEFEELCQRLGDGLSDEKIASIIRDFRMARTKLELSDSLRQRFPVLVDSTRLRALVRNPEEIIDQDPIPFVTREIFN